jgi:mannose-6-phosphate isomerase-like protein (cupin superfamily)
VHPTHGEGFLVLAGLVTFQVADDVVESGPGGWLYAPRDVPHTLANLGADPARLLCFFSPGGFERRFERILAEEAGEPVPPPSEAEARTQVLGPALGRRSR